MEPDKTTVDDPWSTDGLPLQSAWPVWIGLAIGVLIGLTWLAAGRPHHWPVSWIGLAAIVAGGVAAARARPNRRRDAATPWILAGMVAWFTALVVVAIEALLSGTRHPGNDITAIAVASLGLLFLGGGADVTVSSQQPERRLPDAVLARIGPPYPTARRPRKLLAVTTDGSRHEITLVRSGFVARWPRFADPSDVVDIIDTRPPPPPPTAPRVTNPGAG